MPNSALPDSICLEGANQSTQAAGQTEDALRGNGTQQARESLALLLTPGPGAGSHSPAQGQANPSGTLGRVGLAADGSAGLVLGSFERWACVPFLARPPTSRAASLPWPRAKTIYLG